MQHTLIKSITTFMLLCVAPWVHAFTVFTCEPEWASLTRALLPSAQVFSATTHRQDPHHIEARPALIAQLRSADLAVCTGATLEAGWLPTLQQRASNPRIRDGQPGMFYAADQVELIDPYQGTITPFSGDVHRAGNPHLHADPHRVLRVAQALHERLARLLPEEAAAIQTRWRQFDSDWRARLVTWEQHAAPLRGKPLAAQHTTFAYLWRWLDLKQVADLEPKPGIDPSPAHLNQLLGQLASTRPLAVVVAQHQDPRAGKWLSTQLKPPVPLLVIPATVTDDQPDALARWFDQLVGALTALNSSR
ncbi:MAG: zinc ABC transporter substrate-binding protein [Limnohabitans sp.]|jgi:zinc/manganese transport system substrate-binding protein|nr:zinc ABC transporter substrate-binding protein [Limnohabitans sp.]